MEVLGIVSSSKNGRVNKEGERIWKMAKRIRCI